MLGMRITQRRVLQLALIMGINVGFAGCGADTVYVAFGDSITKGVGDHPLSSQGYPPLLEAALNDPDLTVKNAGKSGETSSGGASRIGAVLSQYPTASVVLIQYGTNDARANTPVSASEFKNNMQQIITAVEAAGRTALLARIPFAYTGTGSMQPPCDASSASAQLLNQKIRDYNDVIDELVRSNNLEIAPGQRFTPPDFYANFKATDVGTDGKSVEFNDCLHPNHKGYESMARWWAYALKTPTQWLYSAGDAVHSSPALGPDGRVYVGSSDQRVYAINASGAKVWEYLTEGKVISSPVVGTDGTIYVGSNDGKLHAIWPDGTRRWAFSTDAAVYSSPAIGADGTIYVGTWSTPGKLYAIKPDGNQKWVFSGAQAGIRSCPAVGPNGKIYVGSMDGRLYVIKPDGSKDWDFATGDMVNSSPAIAGDGTVYLGSLDGYLYAIDPNSHTQKWRALLMGDVFSSPAVGQDGTVYVGSGSNRIHALDATRGSEIWTYPSGGNVWSSPAIGADGTIYVGSSDHRLYAINASGQLKWSFETRDVIYSSPAVGADGMVYVGSGDGNIYAVKLGLRSTPSSSAPWPMFHHDRNHTGRTAP